MERTKPVKGGGGTTTIKCHLCQAEWKGIYTRVKAHFMNIPKKGVDACPGDPEDPTKLLSIQMEQHRADGKVGKQISRTSHVVDKDNDDSSEDEMPSKDEIRLGDEAIPSKTSKSNVTANKRPKILGGIYHMFDLKGR